MVLTPLAVLIKGFMVLLYNSAWVFSARGVIRGMIITTQKALNEFCAGLKSEKFITVDTEFLREKTYFSKLCLIQVSGADKDARAIDPLADGLDLQPLYDLLFDSNIIKVFHAARQDLEIIFNLTGKVVQPLFDTQIAAMVCGYGDQVGYERLVREITDAQLDKSVQYTDWSRRPLSERQINYALGDVTHLCDVYLHLVDKLEEQGRTEWLKQEESILLDPQTYQNPLDEAYKRIKIRNPKPKTLAVLRELAAWREKRAQKKNIPRGWIMKDDTLADMAAQAPKDVQGLKKIRNMSKDLADGHVGKALLAAIKKALDTPHTDWPKVTKRKPPGPAVSARMDILKMLVKIQAALHDVAPKLIISNDDLLKLASEEEPDIPALKGWRREVFGEDALAVKRGALAIGLKGSKIEKFEIKE